MQSWWEAYKRGQLNDEQAKYFHAVPPEELFDIQKDPDNVHNLVGDPKYENVLKRMRKINAKWIRHVHDSGFIPESMRMRRVKKANTTVYEYVRSSAYRQEEIISMAEVASMGKPENLEKLINGLKDNDAAIRYWAGYGCAILKEKAMPAKGLLIDLLDDPAPEVAIAASEALYHLGETSKSLDRLKKALDNDSANGEIRLRALNVIRALGKGAMPLLPKLQDMLVSVPPPKRIEPSKNSRWINSFIVIRLIKDSLPSSLKSNAGGYVG
jgi:tetratricopeptide (TPR) repeat protein